MQRNEHYIDFMEWLQEIHPQLYVTYWLHFFILPSTGKICAGMDYIQPEHRKDLESAIIEYYIAKSQAV